MSYITDFLEIAESISDKTNFKKFSILFSWLIFVSFVFFINWLLISTLYSFVIKSQYVYLSKILRDYEIFLKYFFTINTTYLIFWIGWNIIWSVFILQRNYILNLKRLVKDWEFQGILKEENGNMKLNYSDSGCIIKGRQWRDFEMSFKFKIENKEEQRGFGLIVRARDLENYIMIKLDDWISPHLRLIKYWEIVSPMDCNTKSIVDGNWHNCKLIVINNKAELNIDNIIKFTYNLPTHSGISPKPSEQREDKEPIIAGQINFRGKGSVGFRAWGYQSPHTESVEIKDLKIKRKNTWNSLGLET